MNNKLIVKISLVNERRPSQKQMEHSVDLFRGMVEENPEKSKKLIADIANQVIDCWLGGGDSEEEGATTTAENHRNHRAGEIPHQGTD